MQQPVNYIATWFYKESEEEASFYPQMGQKGSSALVHSIYMQIQVPFFTTFKHYNPQAKFLFFTNLKKEFLPSYLLNLFERLDVEIITRPYTCRPPKDWYTAWQNQFYLYDILLEMERRMQPEDTLLISDADCLCRKPLTSLFEQVRHYGSALYEFITDTQYCINGITLPQMEAFYSHCYNCKPHTPITYYGGEFIALRADKIHEINASFPILWQFNLEYAHQQKPKLNEEAHVLSILAEHLNLRNHIANAYVKRMWTTPKFNNVCPGDENYSVWHLPYEKKRGLYYLYQLIMQNPNVLANEPLFWKKAQRATGIPHISYCKRIKDFCTQLQMKIK